MNKIVYSVYTKLMIGALCIASILCALTAGLNGVKQWDDYKSEVYLFEDKFEDSHFLSQRLNYIAYDIYIAAVQSIKKTNLEIYESLETNIDNDYADYYLILDGKEYTNNPDGDKNHMYYYNLVINNNELIEQKMVPDHSYYHLNLTDTEGHEIKIYVGLKESYIATINGLWMEQKALVNGTFTNVTYWVLACLACLIYLMVTIGKDDKGNRHSYPIDYLYIEVNVSIVAATLWIALLSIVTMIEQHLYGDFPFELLRLYTQICIGVAGLVTLPLFLSIIRNLKNKTLFKHCFVWVITSKCMNSIRKLIDGTTEIISNRINLFVVVVLFFYTATIGYFGVRSWYDSFVFCLMGVILFVVMAYFVTKYMHSLSKIKTGVQKIRNGELDYKIEHLPYKDLNHLKDGINDISTGLQASVNKTLKAERLKTELITNVSHDLKTPLTSIINYTQLLSNVENLPEEAKDYIAIIDKKSQRLKTLTQDLFDISKVQSGNDELHLENLNVETLLSQSLAEHEKELENLTVCTNIEEDLFIFSDGRKMSRVINNLLINISKYTLPNTRVFINAYGQNNKVFI